MAESGLRYLLLVITLSINNHSHSTVLLVDFSLVWEFRNHD